ncbi:MAG: ABC transporter permease [Eubacterium sp.]
MFIFKNAFRSINRSKGRNILIGIIVVVIAFSTCVSLSIREAAKTAKTEAISNLSVTAAISYDRKSVMMKNMSDDESGTFDKSAMKEAIQGSQQGLSLEEYEKYANAESVSDFYYSGSVSVNGNDDLEAVNSNEEAATDEESPEQFGKMNGGRGSFMGTQGDFTVVGYSNEKAMTDFVSGTNSISNGSIFEEATENNECIISDELAILNNISVGDTITLLNPNDEDESFDIKVVGTYTTNAEADTSSMKFSASSDPANQIYMSYNALNKIISSLESSSNEDTALAVQTNATYCFEDVEGYEAFENQARELGLAEEYVISSADVEQYKQSLVPLDNLSKFATYFLIVVLAIGGIILVVLNIFNVRERKYEIGVMTAIGMKKHKVAAQFVTEIFTVTIIAMLVGVMIGTPTSVPVTNALLENQIEAQAEQTANQNESFGRGGTDMQNPPQQNNSLKGRGVEYISEVNSATNINVILELFVIAILLTLISSLFAVVFIMRYNPLKILSERD